MKNLPTNAGDMGDSCSVLGQGEPLVKDMATHSSTLARTTLWTEEPGGLQSMGSQESQLRLSDFTFTLNWERNTEISSSFFIYSY